MTLDTYAIDEQTAYLRDWAARHKCVFEDEGECGIGRECVGIERGSAWLDLGPTVKDPEYGYEYVEVVAAASPPPEVVDAYHKHPCLAVLGRGPGAILQLFLWVKSIDRAGLVVRTAPRKPETMIHALIHGLEYVYLDVEGEPELPPAPEPDTAESWADQCALNGHLEVEGASFHFCPHCGAARPGTCGFGLMEGDVYGQCGRPAVKWVREVRRGQLDRGLDVCAEHLEVVNG